MRRSAIRAPKRQFLGLTWLGWLNFAILQWVGLRVWIGVRENWWHDPRRDRVEAMGVLFAVPLSGWHFLRTPRVYSRPILLWKLQ